MKIIRNGNDTITIDFDDTEKELLNFVDENMLYSWAETIARSLDETFRIMGITLASQVALAKKISKVENDHRHDDHYNIIEVLQERFGD